MRPKLLWVVFANNRDRKEENLTVLSKRIKSRKGEGQADLYSTFKNT